MLAALVTAAALAAAVLPGPPTEVPGPLAATYAADRSALLLEASRHPGEPDQSLVAQQRLPPPLELIGADTWHAAGFSGQGVRVAIIDTGFAGYLDALGQTLPASVVTRSFRSDGDLTAGSDHGRRAAEIVHEVAPGAQLYLVNFATVSQLSQAVDYVIEQHVDVVSFSVGFIHDGPGDGRGDVNELIDRATSAGLTWTVAAGNWAEQHWGGFFRDLDGDSVHEFPQGQRISHEFFAGDLITVSLRWNDVFGASCSDYDLELFGPDGALIAASRKIQDCLGDPVESIRVLATRSGKYSVRVIRADDTRARRISVMMVGSPDRGLPLDQHVAAGSLSQPADNVRVITVGAIATGDLREAAFSSRGPTLDLRTKPNVLAPTSRESGATGFAGTSAAAPHAAGVVALLKEAIPDASRAQLISEVFARAIPIPPAPEQTPGVRLLFLGSVAGLGPTLPTGADRATILGLPQDPGIAVGFYQGPDGYPLRFLHLLADGREATSVFRVLLPERTLQRYIPDAPGFVNQFDTLNSGDLLFLRFDQ